MQLTPEGRAKLDEAMTLAGKILGAAAPKWQRLAAICEEFLGAHAAAAPDDGSGDGVLRAPVDGLLEATRAALEAEFGPWVFLAERVAEHFIETWKEALAERSTPQKRAMARDGGLCQVPGCSRAAVHAHHVHFRSRGGSDEPENLTSLCAAHHLRGVHHGYMHVTGRAPDQLAWCVGDGPGEPRPLAH